ncbi:MAG: nucleotidyltransferase domain-containing protein [Planctomycetota bacterium]
MASMGEIRAIAREVGRKFHPLRVLLFGSHAEAEAGTDSDVDLLVIMPFEGRPAEKSAEIRLAIHPSFPVDVVVRAPETVRERLEMGDPFMKDAIERGQVLYEADRR